MTQTIIEKIDPFRVSVVVVMAIDVDIARLDIHHSDLCFEISTQDAHYKRLRGKIDLE
jgi:hypothetical protein